MTSKPLLREAHRADVPVLAHVSAAALEVYRDGLEPPSSSLDKTPEAVRRKLKAAAALGTEQGGEVVGCVFYAPQDDHVYLSRRAVLPEYQGRGVARALLSAVAEKALEPGLGKLRLRVRLVKNVTERCTRRSVTFFTRSARTRATTRRLRHLGKTLRAAPAGLARPGRGSSLPSGRLHN